MDAGSDVTGLLLAWSGGDEITRARLLETVYGELHRLARGYLRREQLVELRFFGGLNVPEIVAVLDVSPITVKRDWALAKAWLYRERQGQA